MRATLSYTLLRVLIFLAAALILALVGLHGLTLIVVALIISAIASLPLLSRPRDQMSTAMTRWVDRFRTRLDEGSKREDSD
ncbi:MAG: DUF4229 domain-containing protein [Actinobacteria bacterium]|nr:DUF4229 domain-containing protein [Actinomycetota bacterium]